MTKRLVFGLAGGLAAVAVLATILLAASPAGAALIRLGFAELAQRSRLVISGEVVGITSYRAPFHDVGTVMFTDVKIRIGQVLKGSPEGQEITIQVLGGRIGDEFQVCLESAKYAMGEKVLVFVRDYNGKLWTTGWMQGKYTIAADGSTVKGREAFPIDRDAPLSTVKSWVDLYGSAVAPSGSGTGSTLRQASAPGAEGSR